MDAIDITSLGNMVDDTFVLVGAAVLLFEIVKGLGSKALGSQTFLDMLASVSTQLPYIVVEVLLLGFVYLGYVLIADNFVSWTLPVNGWTVVAALVACDFMYYWEHRLAHEVRLLWTQHAVHHSSRFMNVLVAVRFGPFEGVASAVIHLPLVLLGFPAELVFFGIISVLAYQVWIHTESIGQLGVVDRILNTPSNHRVHHGCDEKYLDKNYGGVLIIWDRLFGTYQAEEERPRYGLKRDFDSVNPLRVWFSEWPGLFRDLFAARSMGEMCIVLFAHPDRTSRSGSHPRTVVAPGPQ